MRVEFAEQYNVPCCVIDGTERPEAVIERCWNDECLFDDGEDRCCVVQFPNRPPELYTEAALRRSLTVTLSAGEQHGK